MIKLIITDMDGVVLEQLIITAEQSHLLKTDWTGDEILLAQNVAETVTAKWNVTDKDYPTPGRVR